MNLLEQRLELNKNFCYDFLSYVHLCWLSSLRNYPQDTFSIFHEIKFRSWILSIGERARFGGNLLKPSLEKFNHLLNHVFERILGSNESPDQEATNQILFYEMFKTYLSPTRFIKKYLEPAMTSRNLETDIEEERQIALANYFMFFYPINRRHPEIIFSVTKKLRKFRKEKINKQQAENLISAIYQELMQRRIDIIPLQNQGMF